MGHWVGSRAGIGAMKKIKISYPCQESNPSPPVHTLSLYELSYLGSIKKEKKDRKSVFYYAYVNY
jgi:hypothetical protein